MEDQDPESRLEVGADMRKIHHCFHHFKVNFNVSSGLSHILPCSNCNKNSSCWPTLEAPRPSFTHAENSPSIQPRCDNHWAAAGIRSNFSTNKLWPWTSKSFARNLCLVPRICLCWNTGTHTNTNTQMCAYTFSDSIKMIMSSPPPPALYLSNVLIFLSLWSLASVEYKGGGNKISVHLWFCTLCEDTVQWWSLLPFSMEMWTNLCLTQIRQKWTKETIPTKSIWVNQRICWGSRALVTPRHLHFKRSHPSMSEMVTQKTYLDKAPCTLYRSHCKSLLPFTDCFLLGNLGGRILWTL